MSHFGGCVCGAIEFEVTGKPEAMGYCHCNSCRSRSRSGNPFHAFSLWKPEAIKVKAESQSVLMSQEWTSSECRYCARCGGHVMTYHPMVGLEDVFVTMLPTLAFSPTIHVNCGEMILPVRDGLPKLKDFPRELGGSGEMIVR